MSAVKDGCRAIKIGGPLGEAVMQSLAGRLSNFIASDESEPLSVWAKSYRSQNHAGDWYGEHVGKWLAATSLAARRTGNSSLLERVVAAADFLINQQEPSGYLGNYAPSALSRIDSGQAHANRTWDVWVMACCMRGLTEVFLATGESRFAEAIERLVRFLEVVMDSDPRFAYWGNHDGLSSVIVLDPLMDFYRATGFERAKELAFRVLGIADERLDLIRGLECRDVSLLGTGKIYQLCWLFTGLSKLDVDVSRAYQCLVESHLTPLGGPWGGIATHKEVFNSAGFFSPEGLTETCSTMAWIQLNAEMYRQSPEALFAESAERAAVNALLGAMDSNGSDWCYFTFPNGRRNNTYYWACCKSSGALALEELHGWFEGPEVPIWIPFDNEFLNLAISEGYESAKILVKVGTPIRVRIPEWACEFDADRRFRRVAHFADFGPCAAGETINITLNAKPRVIQTQSRLEHHGQEIARTDYFGLEVGPWVYATGPERIG
ncbi:MAG TPA: glycoside hydrolase family 127 protein, partial [Fimbriimonadaceae bacterium]|nr:glycoside hydrolase family 127 protein [Fimbriimonadaceae bacterium]